MSDLKTYRKKLQLSQTALADRLGVSQSQIQRLETGDRRLTKEWAERLAPHLGVSPQDLLFGNQYLADSATHSPAYTDVLRPYGADKVKNPVHGLSTKDELGLTTADMQAAYAPVLGEVAAGVWLEHDPMRDGGEPSDFIPVPYDERRSPRAVFVLVVKGTSLNLTARPGDYLVCENLLASGFEARSGELVIVERTRCGGHLREVTAKRLSVSEDGIRLLPESDDPKWQEPIRYAPDEADAEGIEVNIVARVLWVTRKP